MNGHSMHKARAALALHPRCAGHVELQMPLLEPGTGFGWWDQSSIPSFARSPGADSNGSQYRQTQPRASMTTNIAALAAMCSAWQSAHRCQPQAAGLDPVRAMVTVKATRAVLFAQKLTRRCDCHRVTNLAS